MLQNGKYESFTEMVILETSFSVVVYTVLVLTSPG